MHKKRTALQLGVLLAAMKINQFFAKGSLRPSIIFLKRTRDQGYRVTFEAQGPASKD
jgi:hypothetical protein